MLNTASRILFLTLLLLFATFYCAWNIILFGFLTDPSDELLCVCCKHIRLIFRNSFTFFEHIISLVLTAEFYNLTVLAYTFLFQRWFQYANLQCFHFSLNVSHYNLWQFSYRHINSYSWWMPHFFDKSNPRLCFKFVKRNIFLPCFLVFVTIFFFLPLYQKYFSSCIFF